MDAYTREQNITVKSPVTRFVNTVVKSQVIILKLTQGEAAELIMAIDAGLNDVAAQAVDILNVQLAAPTADETEATEA